MTDPFNVKGDQHAAFVASQIATKEAGATLNTMLQANATEASQEKLMDETEDQSAAGITTKLQKLERKKETKIQKTKEAPGSRLVRKEDADGMADQFSRRDGNKEYGLDPKLLGDIALEELGLRITDTSDPRDILMIVKERMSKGGKPVDPALLDKGLEFLLEVTQKQKSKANPQIKERLEKIYNRIETAKLQHFKENAKAIELAEKIIGAVESVVETTGMSTQEVLNNYREIVHNPPDLQTLRKSFEAKEGGYKNMKLELKGLSRYLGKNFKRENLEQAELIQLAKAARKMQALDAVFKEAKEQTHRFLMGYLKANDLLEIFK